MNCTKCSQPLEYGVKYCNHCGEKVEKGAFEEEYMNTVWGKIEKIEDKYETITLSKFTGHIAVKIFVIIFILIIGIFEISTDYFKIRILPGDNYSVEYNKKEDEYYFITEDFETNINMYIPKNIDVVKMTTFDNNENEISVKELTTEQYLQTPISVKKGEYSFATVETLKDGKTKEKVKFSVF